MSQHNTHRTKMTHAALRPNEIGCRRHMAREEMNASQAVPPKMTAASGWNAKLSRTSPRKAAAKLRMMPQEGQGVLVNNFHGHAHNSGACFGPMTATEVTYMQRARNVAIMPQCESQSISSKPCLAEPVTELS